MTKTSSARKRRNTKRKKIKIMEQESSTVIMDTLPSYMMLDPNLTLHVSQNTEKEVTSEHYLWDIPITSVTKMPKH